MKRKILVSFSGGRSSAFMAIRLKEIFKDEVDFRFVFANTSREREETLVFVNEVDKRYNLGVVWVEAVVHHDVKKSCTHNIVTFETACRNGSVFEEVIKKYGIPSIESPSCTRELKANPIKSYAKSIGWIYGKNYETAIGYRIDEPQRVSISKCFGNSNEKHFYPLYIGRIRKTEINSFWKEQDFDLGLREHEGNCILCFKKSKRKLLTQIVEDPSSVNWIMDMEIKYSYHAAGKPNVKLPVFFFREKESVNELIEESLLPFDKYYDGVWESVEMDRAEIGCESSCEPF